jgi:molybdopterin converting factor small subunit
VDVEPLVRVTVKFMSIVRQHAGTGEVEFSSQKDKLGDVVQEIAEKYNISDLVLTSDGKVRPWARILVNGRSQEFIGGLGAKLSDGDTIALIYSFPYHENV